MSYSARNLVLRTIVLCMVLLGSAALAEEKPAASLVIPYFEVSTSASGPTTLFAVTNAGASPAIAHVTLWTSYWQPTLTFDVVLAAHDIATYNVRDILNGTFPATAPLGMPGCSQYSSPAFGAVSRQTLWQDHQGQTCLASDTGGLAVGIITIDLVRQCTPLQTANYAGGNGSTPLSAGYFANGGAGLALNDNVLLADFHLVDPQQNYAQGDTAFHLPASSVAFPASGDTFYGALGSQGADNRAPLSSVLYARVINGGAFTGGTDLLVWRDSTTDNQGGFACGVGPNWLPLNETEVIAFDEQENATELCFSGPGGVISPPEPGSDPTCFPLETQRVSVGEGDLAPPYDFGWMALNLNIDDVGVTGDVDFGTAGNIAQSYVIAEHRASGRFAVGLSAISLTSACEDLSPLVGETLPPPFPVP